MSGPENQDAQIARINSETAKIAWQELQRFFAQGKAIHVEASLDLVAVAYELSRDNTDQFESWLAAGDVGIVSDTQAGEWLAADALLWAVVVRPWVLVQPVLQDELQ